jgi:hypothetical protein
LYFTTSEINDMYAEELTAHQLDQDHLDQLEEDRLRPIYQAQREVLERFCKWLNDRHPSGAQFEVKPKGTIRDDFKPYLDIVSDTLECKGESDEIDLQENDAWLILHNIYSLETSPK